MPTYWIDGMTDGGTWHGLEREERIPEGASLLELGRMLQFDKWRVEKEQLYELVSGDMIPMDSGEYESRNGVFRPFGPMKLTTISPDGERYESNRTVKSYEPLQFWTMLEALEPLAKKLNIGTVALVGESANTKIVQFKIPPFTVLGDEYRPYLTFIDNILDALYAGLNTLRVVCNNTATRAINSGQLDNLRHSNTKLLIQAVARVFEEALKAREEEQQFYNELFTRKVEEGDLNEFVNAVYPDPPLPAKLKLYREASTASVASKGEKKNFSAEAEKIANHYEAALARANDRRQALADVVVGQTDIPSAGEGTWGWMFSGMTRFLSHPQTLVNGRAVYNGGHEKQVVELNTRTGQTHLAYANGRSWLEDALKS